MYKDKSYIKTYRYITMRMRHDNMTNSRVVRIFTFGWSPEFVVRPLVEKGFSRDDVIVLIASKPETDYARKRVEEAYKHVGNFLQMAGVSKLYYREVDTNKDIIDICKDIVRVVKEFEPAGIFKFYLTGGMRVLVIATLIVAKLLHSSGMQVEIELSREDRPISYTIPVRLLELTADILTKTHIEVLKLLKAHLEARFEDLAIGRSEVTVRKHLTKLRERGLVDYTVKNRKQFYKLSPLGELLLEVVS